MVDRCEVVRAVSDAIHHSGGRLDRNGVIVMTSWLGSITIARRACGGIVRTADGPGLPVW